MSNEALQNIKLSVESETIFKEFENQENIFRDTVSIDPNEVSNIWNLLSEDTTWYEVADYHKTFHLALIQTILESKKLNG